MFYPIFNSIKKCAQEICIYSSPSLDMQDRNILAIDGPKYLRHVQTNIKLKKNLLSDLTDTGKKVLLAYVIFLRQNLTTEQGDRPNEEDAANVLHGDLFKNEKDKKELDENLEKQLAKIGIQEE
jgi:hypothetical protein